MWLTPLGLGGLDMSEVCEEPQAYLGLCNSADKHMERQLACGKSYFLK